MEYRIISRNKPYSLYYYAQMNVFGTWVDCNLNPFVDTYDSFDMKLKVVEKMGELSTH